jgi:hypothetical protein
LVKSSQTFIKFLRWFGEKLPSFHKISLMFWEKTSIFFYQFSWRIGKGSQTYTKVLWWIGKGLKQISRLKCFLYACNCEVVKSPSMSNSMIPWRKFPSKEVHVHHHLWDLWATLDSEEFKKRAKKETECGLVFS